MSSSNPSIFQGQTGYSLFLRSKEILSVRILESFWLCKNGSSICQKPWRTLGGGSSQDGRKWSKKKHGDVSFRPLTWVVGPRSQMAMAELHGLQMGVILTTSELTLHQGDIRSLARTSGVAFSTLGLKNRFVKLDHFPNFWVNIKKYMAVPQNGW